MVKVIKLITDAECFSYFTKIPNCSLTSAPDFKREMNIIRKISQNIKNILRPQFSILYQSYKDEFPNFFHLTFFVLMKTEDVFYSAEGKIKWHRII